MCVCVCVCVCVFMGEGHRMKLQSKCVKLELVFLLGVGDCRWVFWHTGNNGAMYA